MEKHGTIYSTSNNDLFVWDRNRLRGNPIITGLVERVSLFVKLQGWWLLWSIGLDEKRGLITPDCIEPSDWWQLVKSFFDGSPPHFVLAYSWAKVIWQVPAMAAAGASVQLVLPLAEIMQMVQANCGQLLRKRDCV